jgi:U3 small nucleolar RNA-associated protein 4
MPVPTPQPTSSTLPLHRIRFYDETPSPITCLAYPPLPLPPARDPSHKGKAKAALTTTGDELGVLVLARENGDIEIHQWARENERSFGNWRCVKVSLGIGVEATDAMNVVARRRGGVKQGLELINRSYLPFLPILACH